MKTFIYLILLVALAGAIVSGLLYFDHYFPEKNLLACGPGSSGGCAEVTQSKYAIILGLPLAALGLFYFGFIIITAGLALKADGRPELFAAGLISGLALIAFLIDLFLGGIMIRIGRVCFYCLGTYAANLVILLLTIPWLRHLRRAYQTKIIPVVKAVLTGRSAVSAERPLISFYFLSIFLLFAAIALPSYALNLKTVAAAGGESEMEAIVAAFYQRPTENLNLPPSRMTIGPANAEVTIIAFTDFLCTACYELFKIERSLLAVFGGKIRLIHYNFPLDMTCNPTIGESTYPNSCQAARAMIAATELGLYERYLFEHVENFNNYQNGYDLTQAIQIASPLVPPDIFLKKVKSPATESYLRRDIKLGADLKLKVTPTIFISQRRIEGVGPLQFFIEVINRELKKR